LKHVILIENHLIIEENKNVTTQNTTHVSCVDELWKQDRKMFGVKMVITKSVEKTNS